MPETKQETTLPIITACCPLNHVAERVEIKLIHHDTVSPNKPGPLEEPDELHIARACQIVIHCSQCETELKRPGHFWHLRLTGIDEPQYHIGAMFKAAATFCRLARPK